MLHNRDYVSIDDIKVDLSEPGQNEQIAELEEKRTRYDEIVTKRRDKLQAECNDL